MTDNLLEQWNAYRHQTWKLWLEHASEVKVRGSYRAAAKIPRSHAQASSIAAPAFSTMPTQNMKP